MINGINFGRNRKWSAHSDAGLIEEAKNIALPSLMRINSLAKSRVNRNGHAEFGPGEIASVLVIVDKKTGETKPMSKAQVANLIKQGKEAGLFDEESSSRCIVICSRVVQRNSGIGSCKHHNIDKSGNQIIEEIEEVEAPQKASKVIEVPKDQEVIRGAENKTSGHDGTVLEDEDDDWGPADEILNTAINPRLAKNKYYSPTWRKDLHDNVIRATRAVEYANEESNRMITVPDDGDDEW